MQDQDLIPLLLARDEATYRYFIEREKDKILRVCLGFVQNREDAEDICQEVFLELLSSLQDFKGNSAINTWLYRIAVNKSINHLKKAKRQMLFAKMLSSLRPGNANNETPDKKIEERELSGALFRAMDKLPGNQKIAYTLAKFDDMSYAQIAEIMELSLGSVESLIFRAKDNLKKHLVTYYENNLK